MKHMKKFLAGFLTVAMVTALCGPMVSASSAVENEILEPAAEKNEWGGVYTADDEGNAAAELEPAADDPAKDDPADDPAKEDPTEDPADDPTETGPVDLDTIGGETADSATGLSYFGLRPSGGSTSGGYSKESLKELYQEKGTQVLYSYGQGEEYPLLSRQTGVTLNDLLAKFGVKFLEEGETPSPYDEYFREGTRIFLRTTDMFRKYNPDLSEETIAEYLERGAHSQLNYSQVKCPFAASFTYEELTESRYSFAQAMAQAMSGQGNMTAAELYAAVKGQGEPAVPYLSFASGTKPAGQISSAEDLKALPLSRENAYQLCLGQKIGADGEILQKGMDQQSIGHVFNIVLVDGFDEAFGNLSLKMEKDALCVGQPADFQLYTGDQRVKKLSIYSGSVSRATLTKDGVERELKEGTDYTVSSLGWKILDGVFGEAGSYEFTLENLMGDVSAQIDVQEITEGEGTPPSLPEKDRTIVMGGSEWVYIPLSDMTEEWGKNAVAVYLDGERLNSTQWSYEKPGYSMSGFRIKASAFAKGKRADYGFRIAAMGYKDINETVTVANYGADKLYVRLLDGNGKVLKSQAYTKQDLEGLTERTVNYQTLSEEDGITSYRAKGFYIQDLLDDAGITFGSGMTLKLRTNDCAQTGNDPEGEAAYREGGEIGYESLMETPRYYYLLIYYSKHGGTTSTELRNAIENGDTKLNEQMRTIMEGSGTGEGKRKEGVEPMLAWSYRSQVFDNTSSITRDPDPYTKEQCAFRLLLGIAVDPDDPTMVSKEETDKLAAPYVFGIDIIDPTETGPVDLDTIGGETAESATGLSYFGQGSSGGSTSGSYSKDDLKGLYQEKGTQVLYSYGQGEEYPLLSRQTGVTLKDLLEKSGVAFNEGTRIFLRTTDMFRKYNPDLSEETIAEYLERGAYSQLNYSQVRCPFAASFTYEELTEPRYSFAQAIAEAMSGQEDMTAADLYAAVKGQGEPAVPYLSFASGTKPAGQISSADDLKALPLSRENAYQLCLGQKIGADGGILREGMDRQSIGHVFNIVLVNGFDETYGNLSLKMTKDALCVGQPADFRLYGGDRSIYASSVSRATLTKDGVERELKEGTDYTVSSLGWKILDGVLSKAGIYEFTLENLMGDVSAQIDVQEITEGEGTPPSLPEKDRTIVMGGSEWVYGLSTLF